MGRFEVVGEAANGQEVVDLARELKPDVVLMDIRMPVLDGVQATGFIAEHAPSVRVIILTMYRQESYVFEAIKAGARGYLLKDIDEQEFVEAVRAVHRGEALIDPALATRLIEEFRRLSQPPSEAEKTERLTQGEGNRNIAERLAISERTVANRLSEIYQKLQVNNRTQAALLALRRGWAKLDQEE